LFFAGAFFRSAGKAPAFFVLRSYCDVTALFTAAAAFLAYPGAFLSGTS